MDNNEKDEKQQELDQASQKTAHVAGKVLANYYGGEAGGSLYNAASNTEVGKKIEGLAGKAFQANPIDRTLTKALDKSGVLDAIDKGMDLADGNPGPEDLQKINDVVGKASDLSNLVSKNDSSTSEVNNQSSGMGDSNVGDDNNDNSLLGIKNTPKTKLILISSLGSFIFIIAIILIAASTVLGPIENAKEFVQKLWNGTTYFFQYFTFDGFLDSKEQEEAYYEELHKVQKEYHEKGICIDINLITASLSASKTFDNTLNDIDTSEGQSGEFVEMKQHIEVLAKMQIISKKYILNLSVKEDTKVTDGILDSSTAEKVASNDYYAEDFLTDVYYVYSTTTLKITKPVISKFLFKEPEHESNYEFYFYNPISDLEKIDISSLNNFLKNNEGALKKEKYELSIGNYNTRENSVFYWNLVNSFIPDYYSDYLPETGEERDKKIKQMADEIYLLYDEIGPSQSCSVQYAGPSSLCPNGITIENVGTLDFEEYVAGVVSREAYTNEGMEALKAQAVAARTYALNYTNYCQKVIPNSTNAQTFTRDINDRARQAVNETNGVILTYNGQIFSSQYDSFCYDDKDCPDATKNSDGTYSVTYTKVPGNDKHKIILSDSSQYNRITHGQGHAHGMSQLLSYQMAKEGKNYEEILRYFYADGVEIKTVGGTVTITADASIITGQITNYLGDISTFNQNIYNRVKNSGLSTRNGVVAAASTLVSEFYNQTGLKLPYELYPSGKYSGYGVDSSWGTNTGRSDYPLNGLDCSGFISWSIHNGGYKYEVKSARDWGNSGKKRAWKKGTTDNLAQPGDLIYNEPQSANGTTGHIRMIVEVTNEGYIVAEASSSKNGIRTTNVSFTSTGNYYLVDMSDYYETATRVSDYPS